MCLEGKSKCKAKPGRYRCGKCDAVSKKKGDLCKPKEIAKEKKRKKR